MRFNLLISVFTFLIFIQCKNSGSVSEENQTSVEIEVDTTKYAKILVNNLRMRSSPDLQGQQLAQIPEGQIVPLTGMKSHQKESIAIRGVSEPRYWHQIVFNRDTGWIYGGGLEIITHDNVALEAINDHLILAGERVGMITAEDNEASIIEKIGAENIQRSQLNIGEGEQVMGNIIYPGSNNELFVYWENEDFTTLNQIVIRNPEGDWATPEGIKIGMSIEKINAINDQTFQLMGFEWDYSGRVINWQGGKLDDRLKLSFEHHGDISVYPFLQGDKIIYSNNSSLIKVKPTVVEIEVSF